MVLDRVKAGIIPPPFCFDLLPIVIIVIVIVGVVAGVVIVVVVVIAGRDVSAVTIVVRRQFCSYCSGVRINVPVRAVVVPEGVVWIAAVVGRYIGAVAFVVAPDIDRGACC